MAYVANIWPFPDEFAPPNKKEQDEYGLAAAKAMYFSKNRLGYGLSNDAQYTNLTEIAQGRGSTDNIRRMMGFHDDPQPFGTNKDNGANAYIDVQTLNLATKYVNKAVAKLQRNTYDYALEATDPFSVDEAKHYNSLIQAHYALRDWYKTFKEGRMDPRKFFEDLDITMLPEYPEELVFNMSINEKTRRVIDGEKSLKLVNHTLNDMDQIDRECDWDDTVYGHSHIHCYQDENKFPRAEHINAAFWGSSYVDNEDYSKCEYQFFIDFLTGNQIKKECQGKLSHDKFVEILGSNAFPNMAGMYGTMPANIEYFDGLKYYPVMRFYFLSNDNVTYVKRKTKEDNSVVDVVPYEYNSKNPNKKSMPASYTSVYGGSWVINTSVTYKYGRVEMPRSNLVNSRLPIITVAPNQKNGRTVSLLAQMMEPLNMINVLHNRIKEIIAKGYNGMLEFNLTAFENIALGQGGQNWTPMEAIDFLFQTHIAVTRQTVSPYGQSQGQAIKVNDSGLQLADILNQMTFYIQLLENLAGGSAADSMELPDRMTSGNMKVNIAASNESIEFLANARELRKRQTAHMMLLLTQQAKKNGVALKGMIPALGRYTNEFFEVPDELPYCDYGLQLVKEPGPEEWMQFYGDLGRSAEKGLINSSDIAFIKQISNLKIARQVLANREMINEKKAAAMRQQDRDFQMDIAKTTSEDKVRAEMAMLDQKKKNDFELAEMKAKIDEYLLDKKISADRELQSVQDLTKTRIAKETNLASILKEAQRSQSEEHKTNTQSATDITTASMKAESDRVKAEAQAKKAKATKK